MAKFSHPTSFDYFQQSPTLDAKPLFSPDDDMSVLDDKILDSASSQDLPAPRRPSFDHHPSPDAAAVWPDLAPHSHHHHHHHHQQSLSDTPSRHPSQLSTPLFESMPAPFVRASQPWGLPSDSGSCTPTPIYEHFPHDFDAAAAAAAAASHHPFAGGPLQPAVYPAMPYRPGSTYAQPHALPMSPQSSHGWVAAAAAPEPAEIQTKPARKNSSAGPPYRAANLHIRRDGIRKKNARFDIPAERTLSNIDLLISRSTDEDEIKELKQQKRLLRNRQAALDSRQRKKVHTEQLEEDKRRSTSLITELQDAVRELKLREAELLQEKTELFESQQQLRQYVDRLHSEKEELIRSHTLETGELRKKNTILREHIEKLEQASTSGALFRNDFSDYDSLTVDGTGWDDFSMGHEFSLDSDPRLSIRNPTPVPEKPLTTVLSKTDNVVEKLSSQTEFPFSWNAFYMCLLFGAFVASNGSSMTATAIPPLSEEYRAESANVLKAVLASASPVQPTHSFSLATLAGPSATTTTSALPATISRAEMAQISSGQDTTMTNLDDLHRSLVVPTKEQEAQQAFAMTAERYNSLTTLDDDEGDITPQPSNLQQAYALRNSALGMKSTADVYSRSLLWDRVPDKVVRDFRRLVKDCGISVDKHEEPGGAMCTV
ncbi:hypothetical protein LOZ61_002782 [Ophidiomyces ophidiicola]|nr:hypothetical protein LOZ61_002782 [Ophidiomyces ophidiicola]KAI1919667.1 hypothetical protein LOZ64_002175 [Ophidiomyces ophidiicola]KAI1971015.1 hypothetical protein LOZ56_003330 [Ophidiomyces ophidiicola]KAI2007289.1 hypothetical protein LOZ49_004688 [Ophidiomyces ophidiicola]KAI2019018.1 hypothetical protein LOZ46_003541 [Ophidiomyces ophidiicola]